MADDELNQAKNESPPEVEESRQSGDRVAELEQTVANLDSEVVTLKRAVAESEEKLASANHSLTEAVASYKAMVVEANPQVFEELITGDTIEAINESLEKAKTLISRVRQGLEAEITVGKVPAGAPIRTPPDLSALSPREKINYAIGGKI